MNSQWDIAIVICLVLLLVQGFLANRDMKVLAQEIKPYTHVKIVSNGMPSYWQIDGKQVSLERDEE